MDGPTRNFVTNLACVVPKHMIRDKVMVTSLQNLPDVKQKRKGKQLYYARASYDVDKKEFFDYFYKFSLPMRQPKNPDRTFITCEYFDESGTKSGGCGALYHPRCVGTSRKIVDGIGEFKCPLCVRRRKKGMRKIVVAMSAAVDFRRVTSTEGSKNGCKTGNARSH